MTRNNPTQLPLAKNEPDQRVETGPAAGSPEIHGSREFLRTGSELPGFVYRGVVLALASMFAVAWLSFGGTGRTDFDLFVVLLIMGMFFGIPRLLMRATPGHQWSRFKDAHDFLTSRVETATGPLSGGEAWLQIALIPTALAIAAVGIGLVYVLET